MLARAYVADAVPTSRPALLGREPGVGRRAATRCAGAMPFVAAHRAPEFLEALADQCVEARHRPDPPLRRLRARRARRSAASPRTRSARSPSTCTARTPTCPRRSSAGLAELGGFGLSVPEEYGGFATGGESDYIGMVVATEELSRGSLGIGGSLVTRPEILTRALVAGGTEEQKHAWLPRIASGELMVGIMVTEPDFGSDVAGVKVTATPTDGGWLVNGVKTWATFAGRADVLMLLARTDPDRIAGPPRPLGAHRREAARRGPRVRVRRRPRRQDGRPRDRHDRLPRHALLRGRVRQLVRARREPHRRRRRDSAAASTSRWPASRTAGCRPRRARSA